MRAVKIVETPCATCGKPVLRSARHTQRSKHVYCSNECFYRNPFRRLSFVCQQCGKTFTVPKGIVNEHKRSGKPLPQFCSNVCHNLARLKRVARSCGVCGKEFETIPSEIKKGGGKFCSKDCFDTYRRTSGEYFRKLRKKASCKPNGAEQAFLAMFPDSIRFTGDGELWLEMQDGRHRNPDFKVIDQKKVIEIFGSPFHKPHEEAQAIAEYQGIGWKCLVVWSKSLYSAKKRAQLHPIVEQFIRS